MSDDLNTPWYVFPLSRNHASVMNNNGLPIIDKMDTEKAAALVRVVNSHDTLVSALTVARNRLRDMLYQDDGQAWKEAERAMPEIEDVMTRFSRINQEMENAGLLHDKAHVDTGKVRPAQSVRTPEMSYRPGSLPMDAEDEPVGWIYKFGKTTFLAKLPLTDEYIAGGWTAEPVFTRPQPLRELTEDEIDKAWRSATIDYTAPYDQFRIDVARAIIDAARKA